MTADYTESDTVFTMSNASISTSAGRQNNSTADTTVVPGTEGTCYSQTTLFIIGGSSGVAVFLVVIISLICCCCLRYKWRKKLSVERERTDIWSMRTFNNTIINDNFMDYQLASPTTFSYKPTSYGRRKSSGISEHSVRIIDPYSRRSSKNTAASVENISDLRLGNSTKRHVYDQRHSLDDSTLRRNTYSAPGGLDGPDEIVAIPDGSSIQTNHACSSRERALTYSAGKRHKQDRHVLLVHEEYIEDDRVNEFAGAQSNNPYIITEL